MKWGKQRAALLRGHKLIQPNRNGWGWNRPELKRKLQRKSGRNAGVETRAAGASLAPGAQPGLPQMVVMMGTHNNGSA